MFVFLDLTQDVSWKNVYISALEPDTTTRDKNEVIIVVSLSAVPRGGGAWQER